MEYESVKFTIKYNLVNNMKISPATWLSVKVVTY